MLLASVQQKFRRLGQTSRTNEVKKIRCKIETMRERNFTDTKQFMRNVTMRRICETNFAMEK
jgi:hypothetical protein